MTSIKIRMYKNGSSMPERTITIPLRILSVASKLIPRKLAGTLEERGVDVYQILELAQNEEIDGVLCEVDEHRKNERIEIAVER